MNHGDGDSGPGSDRLAIGAPCRGPALHQSAPLAALFLGISSGFPYAMIGATLTTRLKQDGIDKSTITAFTLVFLAYNFKFLWAWVMDGVRIPVLGRLGQRVSWMLVTGHWSSPR